MLDTGMGQCGEAAATAFRPASPDNKKKESPAPLPTFLEFFAGSGLVAQGLKRYFKAAWANDICEKKAAVYTTNHAKKHFHQGSISDVRGANLPSAQLSWASFPCQDLSLAGLTVGIHGERSGLVWEWLRIMDEMTDCPPVLVAENVVGLISADGGSHYRILHEALHERGYHVGAMVLDAVHWVPHSRPRVFVVAVREGIPIPPHLVASGPTWPHTPAVINVAQGMPGWVWWNLPSPPARRINIEDIIEWDAPCDPPDAAARNLAMVPKNHRILLDAANEMFVAPGYKRTRSTGQMLELRFDGVAGCLRTPEGGSSRQYLVVKKDRQIHTRLLTTRETARLMGAPESYKLPGTYNDGYKAMGDAVAVPVARYLARHLLKPLVEAAQ